MCKPAQADSAWHSFSQMLSGHQGSWTNTCRPSAIVNDINVGLDGLQMIRAALVVKVLGLDQVQSNTGTRVRRWAKAVS